MKQWLFHKQVIGDCTRNLRNFNAVRQARAIEVRLPDPEYLSFPLQSAEGGTVKNTVPIPFRSMTVIF